MRRAPEWLTGWEYAHRGLHSPGVPENSLAAASAAIAAGMGIECDIQFSRDGVPIVFHDYDLDRLVGAGGKVIGRKGAELAGMSLSGGDEKIPTLKQFLSFVAGRVPILIEIKWFGALVEPNCQKVMDVLSGYSGEFAVMSFDHWVVRWIRTNHPDATAGLVMRQDEYGHTQTQEDREFAFDKASPDFLAYHVAALSNPWVGKLRKNALPVLTWTVNSPDTRATALAFADAMISEREGLA